MYFFSLDQTNGINLGAVASYHIDGETVTLKLYDRSVRELKGEQADRFKRALKLFTLGLVIDPGCE